jgi:transposase
MRRIEQEVAERLGPFQSEVGRLCTIPGVDRVTAWGLLAEIGLNMNQFTDAQHLASWAGLGPGSHESAGKRKSGKIRKGSLWLRRCLGRLHEEEQLFVGSVSPAGSAKRNETHHRCGGPQSPGHCLLHLARRNLLPRSGARLL